MTAMASTDYTKLKVTELKEILKERGIPSTGLSRKKQIVEALEKWDGEQQGATEVEVEEEAQVTDAAGDGDAGTAEEGAGAEDAIAADVKADEPAEETPGEALTSESLAPAEDAASAPPSAADIPSEPTAAAAEAESPSTQQEPTILESNDPVSTEPSSVLATTPEPPESPAPAGSTSSDTRKRKRRSPTPPLSQESVNKKLKAAEEEGAPVVKLPEDMVVEEEKEEGDRKPAVAVDRSAEMEGKDVEMREGSRSRSRGATSPIRSHSDDAKPQPMTPTKQEEEEDTTTTTPSLHPATRALYIRDLVRPLQPTQLRSHLINLATPTNTSPSDSILELFHLDTIRTHAFAIFNSTSAAARARSKLHGVVWPDEAARKELWVDFLPEEKAEEFIRVEEESATGKRDAKRWEVVYITTDDGELHVELREAPGVAPPSASMGMRQNSFSGGTATASASASGMQQRPGAVGEGMPNAPLGPRGARSSSYREDQPPPLPQPRASATPVSPTQTKRPTPSSSTFQTLDTRFSSTTSKPKLYYLPVPASLVSSRLSNLAEITSRDWDDRKPGNGSFGTGAPDEIIRRYTFEDGDKVVDGGADIGNFGREGYRGGDGMGGGGFEGRGRGGRGGRRGGRR